VKGAGERLQDIYRRLFAAYGPQGWWPGEAPFEVMVGAVLTQAAAWSNVEKAIANLRRAGALDPEALGRLSDEQLARLIRPSGYFNAKARKLKALAALIAQRFGGDVGKLLATPAAESHPPVRRRPARLRGGRLHAPPPVAPGDFAPAGHLRCLAAAVYGHPPCGRGPVQRVPCPYRPPRQGAVPPPSPLLWLPPPPAMPHWPQRGGGPRGRERGRPLWGPSPWDVTLALLARLNQWSRTLPYGLITGKLRQAFL